MMWFRQARRTHPTEINHASLPVLSELDEVLRTDSGQPIPPNPQPLEREETTAGSPSSDQTSGTGVDDAAGASRAPTENRAILGELPNEGEDEEDTETRLELIELARSRSIRRRRLFVCILILSLLLLRLYYKAMVNSDYVLFWACLILTSWLMRWINSQREAEELMDERMEHLWREDTRRSDDDDVEAMNADERRRQRRRRRNRQRTTAVDGDQELNFRMLSFQAQLSMAIMESQRHILVNGGYGRPDGDDAEENRGVTDEAKRHWEQIEFDQGAPATNNLKSEDQSCCICLAEYESGDDLYVVPCGHMYHTDCINSWCTSHIRCPLCNFDLEKGRNDTADEECAAEVNSHDDVTSSGGLEAIV